MGQIFSKGQYPVVIPEFASIQIQTAVQALPIPIIYGSPRISNNLIYYNGFNVQLVNTGGGKGILSGGKGSQEVEYFATIISSLGEGPLGNIEVIYQDQAVYVPGDYPSPNFYYFNGTDTQAPWSVVVDTWPDDARSYKDTAYFAVYNAELDSSATVPQINFVVQGLFTGTCPLNNTTITITSGQYDENGNPISYLGNIALGDADADPATCIVDFLTNPRYGANFPASLVDTTPGGSIFSGPNATNIVDGGDGALQTYCQAVGFGWSVYLSNPESASSIIDTWCKNLVVAPVWTGELLKFIPYWWASSEYNTGYDPDNPFGIPQKSYLPAIPIVEITLDHILQAKSQDADPMTIERVDPMLVKNFIMVDFADRTNFFNDNVAMAENESQIDLYGAQVDNIGMADEFTLAAYAQTSAYLRLKKGIIVRRKMTFRLGPLWAWLDPMDVVILPDASGYCVESAWRIISCEDDEDEITTYVAEEYPGPLYGYDALTYIFPASPTTPPDQGATNNSSSGSVWV